MMNKVREARGRFWRGTAWTGTAHRRWFGFCAVCLALYIAYVTQLSSSRLFVSATDTVASLVWFALIAAGVYGLLLFACGRLCRARVAPDVRKAGWRFMLLSVTISLAILGCAYAAAYPGGVTYDASNQWRQALSGEYNNWHPVFHTLLVGLGARVLGSYSLVLLMQLVAFALAMGALALTARNIGAPAWLVLLLQALTAASPLVRNTLMTVGKDGAMAVGALLLLAQAIKLLATRGEWLHRPVNALAFGLTLAFTTMTRHNAMLFTLPLLLFALCCYPAQRKRALVAAGVLVACVALVQGALYSTLDVVYPQNTLEESVGVPMTILCDQKQRAPEKLDPETDAFLSSLATDESWRDVYRPHDYNSIKFTYAREHIAKLPADKLLRMTLATVRNDPRAAFESVNAVTDLVWGVTGENAGVEDVGNTGDIEAARYGSAKLNALGGVATAFLDGLYAFAPLTWLFENIGAMQLLLLLIALWALYRGGTNRLALALPALCYNLATMLLLCGNDARFFMFFMAGAPMCALALCYLPPRLAGMAGAPGLAKQLPKLRRWIRERKGGEPTAQPDEAASEIISE